jgi:hypothetical protein
MLPKLQALRSVYQVTKFASFGEKDGSVRVNAERGGYEHNYSFLFL